MNKWQRPCFGGFCLGRCGTHSVASWARQMRVTNYSIGLHTSFLAASNVHHLESTVYDLAGPCNVSNVLLDQAATALEEAPAAAATTGTSAVATVAAVVRWDIWPACWWLACLLIITRSCIGFHFSEVAASTRHRSRLIRSAGKDQVTCVQKRRYFDGLNNASPSARSAPRKRPKGRLDAL